MKNLAFNIYLLLFFITISSFYSCSNNTHSIDVEIAIVNPAEIFRKDEIIKLNIESVQEKNNHFDQNSFIVLSNDNEIPSQTSDSNNDGEADQIIFISDFQPGETKNFIIKSGENVSKENYKKRTQAYLGKKVDYKLEDGYYTAGRFESVDSAVVPEDHFAHNALFQFEGPGWESELVAYRFYLDSRNRTDIFGKKVNDLILPQIGRDDLVSDSKESYTKMTEWGLDIFKVGDSFGIGAFSGWKNDSAVFVSDVDSIISFINNETIKSGVYTKYLGWNVRGKKYDLYSDISITAGSRLSNVNLTLSENDLQIATGFAKYEGTEFIKNDNEKGWNYIALWGKQTTADDNLGIAVLYNSSNLIKLTEDKLSYIIVLKPENDNVNYYFSAAWEKEKDGIKNKEDFLNYLKDELLKLNNPLQINF